VSGSNAWSIDYGACAQKFNFILPSPIYDKINRIRSFLIGQTKIWNVFKPIPGMVRDSNKHSVFRIHGAILCLWNAKMLALPLPPPPIQPLRGLCPVLNRNLN
jgi:hypothetical protein